MQSNDTWMNEPAFELPKHVQQQNKLKGKLAKQNTFLTHNTAGKEKLKSQEVPLSTNFTQVKDEDSCHHVVETEEGVNDTIMKREIPENVGSACRLSNGASVEKQEMSVQTVDPCLIVSDLENASPPIPEKDQLFSLPWCPTPTDHEQSLPTYTTHGELLIHPVNQFPICNWPNEQEPLLYHTFQSLPQGYQELYPPAESTNQLNYNLNGNTAQDNCIVDNNIADNQYSDETQDFAITTNELDDQSNGVVIVVDNSNIYIGAQECASANNAADKKRHVRVKLQNLVKILEKNRPKERTFVCGSSPPATEHVWDVYR